VLQHPKRILVGFVLVEALRDVLQGVISYSKSQNRNWELECVDLEEFEWRLKRKDLDGAISHINPRSRKWPNRFLRSGVPVVNTLHDTSPQLASVLSDDPLIGESGAAYFFEHGFRSFGFFGFETEWSQARGAGFKRFVESRSQTSSFSEKVIARPQNWNLEDASLRTRLWTQKKHEVRTPRVIVVTSCRLVAG